MKMLKKLKKLFAFTLCAVLALSGSAATAAAAADTDIVPYTSLSIYTATAELSKSGSTLYLDFSIRTNVACSRLGVQSVTVYDVTSGTSKTISGRTTSGTNKYSSTLTYAGTKGHSYYMVVKFVAASGGETIYATRTATGITL